MTGLVLGLVARFFLTIFGGSRLEGFLLAWVVGMGWEPNMMGGFTITFIGTRALSAPADVFILTNSRRDPILHSMKQRIVGEGLGHMLVKQIAITQTLIGGAVLVMGAIMSVIMTQYEAMMSIMLSPFAIIALQLCFAHKGYRENGARWLRWYLGGLVIYSLLGWSYMGSAGGYGMLIALNLLFFDLSDLFPKGKIAEQVTCRDLGMEQLPWGKYGLSYKGMIIGLGCGFFIGCPTSLGVEASLNRYETEESRIATHTAAAASSEMMSLLLWLWWGFSRSSYADALGKSGIEIDPTSVASYAIVVTIIAAASLLLVEKWSYFYMAKERLVGKLINFLVFVGTLILCGVMAGPLTVLLSLAALGVIAVLKHRYKFPEESKLSMLGIIPLISINWLSFFTV